MQSPNFIVAVVLVAVLIASSCSHDLDTDDQHNTFEALTKVLNEEKTKPSLSYRDVENLFLKLHFQNCTNGSSSNTTCWKCFTVPDLYQHFNLVAGSGLNETTFTKVSPAIVYHLLPEKNPGSSGPSGGGCTSSLPKSLFAAFSNNKTEITLPVLDEVLENVNKSLGQSLTKKKCFSARSVLHDVKSVKDEHEHEESHSHEEEHGDANSLDKDQFEKACGTILSHLVQGYCIEEDHGELPPKSFFLDNLFENTTHLSEDKLLKVTKKLEIGTQSAPEKDSHAEHNHRRRRSLDAQKNSNTFNHRISRRSTDEHDHSSNISYEGKCYSLDNLFKVFDVDHSVGATKSQLKELCPSLLQQFISGSCSATKHTSTSSNQSVSKSEAWGYGFIAVTIISVLSLIGVATVPFVGKKMYKKVLSLLVALAVGSLTGDSLLHLLPHSFGLHEHSAEPASGDSHGHGHSKVPDFIWKAFIVIVSIYCFYLFETLMHFVMAKKYGKVGHSHVDTEIPGQTSGNKSLEHNSGKNEKSGTETGIVITNVNSVGESEENMASPHNSDKGETRSLKSMLSQKSVFSEEEGFKRNKQNKVSSYAWMIIIGDTIHNISDGLAIGAAFSEPGSSGIAGGISTSIAVFCHELPHELGDFAVLLSAGMSVKKALLANFLSACSCYIGLFIGLEVGQTAGFRMWIFAIAGGMFLYVALVDMLPDLMHSESVHTDALVTFILQNVGLWVGFGLMLLIAVYEEELRAIKF